jgi:antitoxin component of MazEF toxin-antitoxin module
LSRTRIVYKKRGRKIKSIKLSEEGKKVKRIEIRKVFRVGKSLVFAIPPEFVKEHNLKPGQQVALVYNGYLKAKPVKKGLKKTFSIYVKEGENEKTI